MALQIHSTSFLANNKSFQYHHLLYSKPKSKLTIQSQKPTPDNSTAPKKPTPPGLGFGSSSPSSSSSSKASGTDVSNKKKHKGKRERASIIRRSPVERPAFVSQEIDEAKAKEQGRNESAFLLAWLGLGGIILVQGIILSASGFLPDEWDKYFVKYLYPSFTPTVFLFVAGTVTYGVLKYLQNEELKDQK
ncbi:protein LPA2 [Ricinus communis]|uniref:Protein LOW PSII ACCUMULATION 2, chloroplastic n=1 Tax=Ricinus communis TaxID=3988 RepID=B9R9P9_RICCO|nr:protein LPA2 [Ricinus communis]EEF51526.1 conserved hypothetical protein [Ricinus communis]|eukprot:XP_002510924.1 protein LOW PSII ACCUMULATION 2, chloroplastic [Ricinus communis]